MSYTTSKVILEPVKMTWSTDNSPPVWVLLIEWEDFSSPCQKIQITLMDYTSG